MLENNTTINFSDEQLENIKTALRNITELFDRICKQIKNIFIEVFDSLKKWLESDIKIIKRRKKGKRYIFYIKKKNYICFLGGSKYE
ncbi:MAG: hypothetical protein ACI31R_05610 [Bacilli bacterium]